MQFLKSKIKQQRLSLQSCHKTWFRRRSTHVSNLTDQLNTAKERRLNQFGTAVLVWCGKSVKFDRVCRNFVDRDRLDTRCAVWIRCRASVASKVELIQLGSAHEKYCVWTRPKFMGRTVYFFVMHCFQTCTAPSGYGTYLSQNLFHRTRL